MKKLFVLMAALMLLPVLANAAETGDPGFHYGFEYTTADVIKGETFCDYALALNYGFGSYSPCLGTDTFCVNTTDLLDWPMATGFDESEERHVSDGDCFILDPGTGWWWEVCIEVPCDAAIDDENTVTAVMSYCHDDVCAPEIEDCLEPNVYQSVNRYHTTSMTLTVVESPPALYILQDSIYYVEQGASNAYVPFGICNGDPCAPATDYGYSITSAGTIEAIDTTGSILGIEGGLCGDVYAILNAGETEICDWETFTIIAWDAATGTVYDTCVQLVHIVEPVPVPLFTTPVVTILVLAMILAAAVIMKRTAASKA